MKEKILVVDDLEVSQFVLSEILCPYYEVVFASDGLDGFEMAVIEKPDLILMDIIMPVIDGFEATRLLKANPLTKHIPVIFITVIEKTKDIIKAFEIGGLDYIIKPFNPLIVLSRIKTQLALYETQKRLVEHTTRNSVHAMGVTVNHDIRQPLTVLQGHFDKLVMNLKAHNAPFEQHDVDKINDAIRVMVNLLNKYSENDNFAMDKYISDSKHRTYIPMIKYNESS